MKYIIERTSIWDDQEKPCEEAFAVSKVHMYSRLTAKRAQIKEVFNSFTKSNHNIKKKEDGSYIGVYNYPANVWVGEVKDLHKFAEKYGRIILNVPDNEEGLWTIEIYDDYRE